jgi:hypothetical protein
VNQSDSSQLISSEIQTALLFKKSSGQGIVGFSTEYAAVEYAMNVFIEVLGDEEVGMKRDIDLLRNHRSLEIIWEGPRVMTNTRIIRFESSVSLVKHSSVSSPSRKHSSTKNQEAFKVWRAGTRAYAKLHKLHATEPLGPVVVTRYDDTFEASQPEAACMGDMQRRSASASH